MSTIIRKDGSFEEFELIYSKELQSYDHEARMDIYLIYLTDSHTIEDAIFVYDNTLL